MTVKELIADLQKCNPDAQVLITTGTEEQDTISTSDFEIHGQSNDDYIELFVDEENCVRQL
jgi:hypothetical protein